MWRPRKGSRPLEERGAHSPQDGRDACGDQPTAPRRAGLRLWGRRLRGCSRGYGIGRYGIGRTPAAVSATFAHAIATAFATFAHAIATAFATFAHAIATAFACAIATAVATPIAHTIATAVVAHAVTAPLVATSATLACAWHAATFARGRHPQGHD